MVLSLSAFAASGESEEQTGGLLKRVSSESQGQELAHGISQAIPEVLVCLSGSGVVGVACLSEYNAEEVEALQKSYELGVHTLHKTAKLQQLLRSLREKLLDEQAQMQRMQCRFDDPPPLANEAFLNILQARATRGNIVLKYFAMSPILAPLQNVILREVMRSVI